MQHRIVRVIPQRITSLKPWLAPLWSILLASIFGLLLSPRLPAADELTPKSRMAILRGLIAEYCTVRVGLPLGEKGASLDSEGQIDQSSLTREISQNGTAVKQDTLAQITALAFHDKE